MEMPLFVKFGDKRIKLKNIKDYGMSNSKDSFYYTVSFDVYSYYAKWEGKLVKEIVETVKFSISEEFKNHLEKDIHNYKELIDAYHEINFTSLPQLCIFFYENTYKGCLGCCFLNEAWYGRKILEKDWYSHENSKYIPEIGNANFPTSNVKFERNCVEGGGDYLYVTTYQNDNYRFYQKEVAFDIKEKFAQLDKYLAGE